MDEHIKNWRFITNKEYYEKPMLFYKPTGKKQGFHFYCCELVGSSEIFCLTEVSCIFYGVAYFDGVRHLYFGDEGTDNFGYLYYPKLDLINSMLQCLKMLEKKFCNMEDS